MQTQRRRPVLERPWARRLTARVSTHIWGPLLPIAARLPARPLARIAALLTPEDFARSVAAASDDRLAAAMDGRMRGIVLDEIIRRMESEFVPERAGGIDAIIEFAVTGRPDGARDVYQLVIRDQRCVAAKGLDQPPKLRIELGAVDFLKLASGVERGMDLYLAGALKFDGRSLMLTRLTSMFQIPDGRALSTASTR